MSSLSSNLNSYMMPVAAVVTALVLLSTKSEAFSPALTSFERLGKPLLASNDEGQDFNNMQGPPSYEAPRFSEEELTRAREMEVSRSDYDFSEGTCAFDHEIAVKNIYGDDTMGMVRHLPALYDQCKQLEKTSMGLRYAEIRLPMFIIGSNKLEGTLSTIVSEDDTFKFLLDYVQQESTVAKDLIPISEKRIGKRPPTWKEEGENATTEAWYE